MFVKYIKDILEILKDAGRIFEGIEPAVKSIMRLSPFKGVQDYRGSLYNFFAFVFAMIGAFIPWGQPIREYHSHVHIFGILAGMIGLFLFYLVGLKYNYKRKDSLNYFMFSIKVLLFTVSIFSISLGCSYWVFIRHGSYDIYGKVVKMDGTPVDQAQVMVLIDGETLHSRTDRFGEYRFVVRNYLYHTETQIHLCENEKTSNFQYASYGDTTNPSRTVRMDKIIIKDGEEKCRSIK
ncbi:MAG: hypothetical protein HQL63_10890 [Magnetococcales bacterium]|nr:hypothetical protein [Magnetococcales bacterium]